MIKAGAAIQGFGFRKLIGLIRRGNGGIAAGGVGIFDLDMPGLGYTDGEAHRCLAYRYGNQQQ